MSSCEWHSAENIENWIQTGITQCPYCGTLIFSNKTDPKQKKLLYIGLEPDMWFELADHLQIRLTGMNMNIQNSVLRGERVDPKAQRNYLYLKSIVSLLETQLTQ